MTRPNTGSGTTPVRWCEHPTKAGQTCPRLAVVLVADFYGFLACVCRDHWHHLHHTTGGAIRAVQLLPRTTDHHDDDGGNNGGGNGAGDDPEGTR